MLTITQHIERLLLLNDCVIIPDFGGFVVQECCARYVEDEGIFLPPYRGVVFNPRLTANDGLLTDAVARDRSIDYHEASKVVEEETRKLRSTISTTGSCNIPGIGVLRAIDGGSHEFEPVACGIASPTLHGLDSYYVPLYHAQSERKAQHDGTQLADHEVVTIRLRRSHLRRIAVAAIVVCVGCLLTLMPRQFSSRHDMPGEAGMLQQLCTAITEQWKPNELQPTALPTPDAEGTHPREEMQIDAQQSQPQQAEAQQQENATADTADAGEDEELVSVEEPTTPLNTVTESATDSKYTIVVASAIPQRNASAMVDEWQDRHMPEARTLKTGSMVRVVCGTYATEQAARKALQHYRNTYDEFADAWIYHIK